jgi:hypothetical protein
MSIASLSKKGTQAPLGAKSHIPLLKEFTEFLNYFGAINIRPLRGLEATACQAAKLRTPAT